MGKSANSAGGSGDGDGESKVHVAVIGVGVGLAAGLAAPLMAGVALSAIGFTSAGMSILGISNSTVTGILHMI